MNESSFRRFEEYESKPGDVIGATQIKQGDTIEAYALYTRNPVRSVTYLAQHDGDTQGFSGTGYNFKLVERPKPLPNFPQTQGAIIKFPDYVPVILTKNGWLFTSKIANGYQVTYYTPEELAAYVGEEYAAKFEVLYAGG